MSKKRVKEKRRFDEFVSDGKIDLARIGNIVSLQSHYSAEEIKEHNRRLSAKYETIKCDIEKIVQTISDDLKQCNPLMIMLNVTDFSMMQLLHVVSESQLKMGHSNNLRLIEYIQSIFVSQTPEDKYLSEEEQNKKLYEIMSKVEELYEKCKYFIMIWAAKAQTEGLYSEEEVRYIVESQLMSFVRGNRYQFQQLRDIEKLLQPHSDKIYEVYGMTVDDLMHGLKKLEYSLSSAKLDSYKEITHTFELYQEKINGKSDEETRIELERQGRDDRVCSVFAKCFGSDLYDVKKVTEWTDSFIDSLSWDMGEATGFLDADIYSGWPILDLPVQKRPFIRINGISYCFDYYNTFDNIYRVIQKNIKKHDESYVNEWSRLQQEASEQLVAQKFSKLLPGADVYVGNYYPKTNSKKQLDENDILVIYDNCVIVVEVKAGSFTYTPAITDYEAHKNSFDSLIRKADYQCVRTINYIEGHQIAVFYDNAKQQKFVIHRNSIRNLYTICVTVDNFDVFEAKIEKNIFFNMSSGTIAISLDDLDVYEEYFDSALYFLHYLKHRKKATMLRQLMLNDELDHLGMYITHNAYDDYVNKYPNCNSFIAAGYRESLDAYFAGLYNSEIKTEKPVQPVPEYTKKIIEYLSDSSTPGRVDFICFLLDMNDEARNQFNEQIANKIDREKQLGYVSPFWVEGDFAYCCFVRIPNIEDFETRSRRKYTYANLLDRKRNDCWEIHIDFDDNNQITKLLFHKCQYTDLGKDGFSKEEIIDYLTYIKEKRKQQGICVPPAKKRKIYPNDSCPCGSGKKYKKCCGRK